MEREFNNRGMKKVVLLLALFFVIIAWDTPHTITSASASLDFSLAEPLGTETAPQEKTVE